MEAINQLLEELKPIDFSDNITNLNNLVSKAFIPLQIENTVEYNDIKKLFSRLSEHFIYYLRSNSRLKFLNNIIF